MGTALGGSRARGLGGLLIVLLVLLAGSVIALTEVTPAHACSCAPISRADAAAGADVILFGTVRTIRPVSDPEAGSEVTFDVRAVYKGTAYTEQLVRTPGSSGTCGLEARPGDTMLIFADERAQPATEHAYELVTTLCDGNVVTDNAPRGLGQDYPPLPGSSADVGAAERTDEAIVRVLGIGAVVVLGLVIIGGGALFWLWRPGRTER